MTDEIFKTIPEFPNYKVSNYGNVMGNVSGIILKPQITKTGYLLGTLCLAHQKQTNKLIHRLVAQTFIPNPLNYPQVNHIDGNKQNNMVSNLEWCTYAQNKTHTINVLDAFKFLKTKPIARKLTIEQVIKIKHIFKTQEVNTELINSIASEHNVNPQTIRCIYWGKTWTEIQ